MFGPPTHLLVLVNGLWGWQRDWAQMKKALEAQNDGSFIVHVSSANVGAQTYAGIDVCGQRLAQEVQQLVSSHPSLTTISFMGHSMGGLIARFAIGLTGASSSSSSSSSSGGGGIDSPGATVAGLEPCMYISIATPHIGCSSSHPEEVHWQDRSYMRWLATAVAAGHLGGHEHLAQSATAAAAAGAAAASGDVDRAAVSVAGVEPQAEKKASGSSSSSTANSSSSSSRSWPWTPCRSVIQLLGCDSWQPMPELLQAHAYSSSSSSGGGGGGSNGGRSKAGGAGGSNSELSAQVARHAEAESSSDCIVQCTDHAGATGAGPGSGKADAAAVGLKGLMSVKAAGQGPTSSSSSRCACKRPQLQVALLPVEHKPFAYNADDHPKGIEGPDSSSSSRAVSEDGPMHVLDVLCRDVLVTCQGCGASRKIFCLSGLRAFKHRLTYSSAGGDHLIPWSSSAVLLPKQLPVRATKRAAAATADNSSQQPQLPVLGLWTTKPAIVEQHVQQPRCSPDDQQQQQQKQQQQQQQHPKTTPNSPAGDQTTTAQDASAAAEPVAADAASGYDSTRGLLRVRLQQLQGMPWRRMHVVWPRLCLGSSHCNIQYNGPMNFVGQAVVAHVCEQVLQA